MSRPLQFRNARILRPTGLGPVPDSTRSLESLAIIDGRVVETPDPDLTTEIVDLEGRWIIPAFCDSHLHLVYASQWRSLIALPRGAGADEVARLVWESRPEGDWILGAGWDDCLVASLGESLLARLDAWAPDRPLFLWSTDHHRALLNSVAASRLDVAPGLLVEVPAMEAWHRIPVRVGALDAEIDRFHGWGITAVTSFDGGSAPDVLRERARAGRLPLRVGHSMAWEDFVAGGAPSVMDRSAGHFRLSWVKLFLDGTLGSRTAWLFEDYSDAPGERGVERMSRTQIDAGLEAVAASGLGLAIHAIGDRAVDVAAEIIMELRGRRGGPGLDRIEHAELIADGTLDRIAAERIPVSVQPCHLLQDIPLIASRWGDRSRQVLPLCTLRSRGVPVVFGSDHPIESPDPWRNIRVAMERRDAEGRPSEGFHPEERLDFAEAFRAATCDAAELNDLPSGWGTLEPGAPADLQILEVDDPREVTTSEESQLRALLLAGDLVWGQLP